MSRSHWTEDDDTQLRKLALAGLSIAEISREMTRGTWSVRARAIRLDIAIARDVNGAKKRRPFSGFTSWR
jgi:hypothetical protein